MQWAVVGCCIAALFALSAAKAVVDEEVGQFHCPYPDGKFMDPKHCDKYYVCVGGVSTHEKCGDGEAYNPWTQECGSTWVDMICKVYIHPENHHIRHTYYISACNGDPKPFCTAPQANDTCHAAGLEPVAIKNWDEDTFLKDYTREFEVLWSENVPHNYPQPPFTYWTCGWRTEQSGPWHRDFRWWADNSYMGYTDWCDAGLLKKDGAPMFPDSCRPDSLSHGCVNLNTSYIESYGWWDAADCNHHDRNFAICEHNENGEYTTPHPDTTTTTEPTTTTTEPTTTTTTPTTTTTTPTTTTPEPTRPPTEPLPEDAFLTFACFEETKSWGRCEHYYWCEEKEGALQYHRVECIEENEEADSTWLFDQEKQKCVPPEEYPVEECADYGCEEEGIFPHRRNCARFYSCVNIDGQLTMKNYTCPNGWLYDASQDTCITYDQDNRWDPTKSVCSFTYADLQPHEPDVTTQCEAVGRFPNVDPDPYVPEAEDDFILCVDWRGELRQIGPFYCLDQFRYNGDTGKCEPE